MKKLLALVLTVAMLLSMLSFAAAEDKAVNIGVTSTLTTLNPLAVDNTEIVKYAVSLVFLPLVELNEKLEFVPQLAESITTEDNLTFTIKLQENAVWSDGVPVTAEDVAFTLAIGADPVSANAALPLYSVEGTDDDGFIESGAPDIGGVRVVDDKTLTVTTNYGGYGVAGQDLGHGSFDETFDVKEGDVFYENFNGHLQKNDPTMTTETPVLTIDSDVSFEGRSTCISTQNLSAGAIAARAAANFVDGSGEVGIICHKANAQTAIERKGGFVDEIEGSSQKADTPKNDPPKNDVPDDVPSDVPGDTPDGEAPAVPEAPAAPAEETQSSGYPGMKIVETKYCEGNIELSKAGTIQLLSEHPDLKVIYATNQPGTVGACQAIDELGRADDITLVGFDYFDGADAYIQSGVLDAVIAQNPYNMGYLGVRYAKRLIDGETIAASVDTGATLITADNLQDADIRWLVDPTGKAGK